MIDVTNGFQTQITPMSSQIVTRKYRITICENLCDLWEILSLQDVNGRYPEHFKAAGISDGMLSFVQAY